MSFQESAGVRPHRPIRATLLLVVSAAIAVLASVIFGAPASASGTATAKPQVVRVTVHLPALVLDNLCNADVVNLSGDLNIVTVTAPYRGGYAVGSQSTAKNLTGTRIAPLPMIGYRGDDRENSYAYYAPPPYPSTFTVLHWTKLVPQSKTAPTMWLVVVTRETVTADGTTVPVVDRAYLTCTQPSDHRHPEEKRDA